MLVLHKVRSKKPLFCLCSLAMGIFVGVLAAFPQVKTASEDGLGRHLDWLPVVATVLALLAYSLGILPGIFILMSEIFPTDIR